MLTSTLPATSTAVPFASRLPYLEVASNAVPTLPTVTTPLAKGSELTSSEPRAPPSPEGKGPAPRLGDTAKAELAVTSATGVSFVNRVTSTLGWTIFIPFAHFWQVCPSKINVA